MDRPKFSTEDGKTLMGDGRVIHSWFFGNFEWIKKGLEYKGELFMLNPFKQPPARQISGGGFSGPPLTQDSQLSQLSEISYYEELEDTPPDNHFICSGCNFICFDEKTDAHECPRCSEDYCRECIVWYLGANVVESEDAAGDDRRFLCKHCANPDPITDGDDSTTDDGSFHPIVRGLNGQEIFNGHTDF